MHGLDHPLDVLGAERGAQVHELRHVGAVQAARQGVAEQGLGSHLAVDLRPLEVGAETVEVGAGGGDVRMGGVVGEVDVAQHGHPVVLDPFAPHLGRGERRRRGHGAGPGVGSLEVERQAGLRIGQLHRAAHHDVVVVGRLAARHRVEQALVSRRVDLAEAVVRQRLRVVADVARVARLVAVVEVLHDRLVLPVGGAAQPVVVGRQPPDGAGIGGAGGQHLLRLLDRLQLLQRRRAGRPRQAAEDAAHDPRGDGGRRGAPQAAEKPAPAQPFQFRGRRRFRLLFKGLVREGRHLGSSCIRGLRFLGFLHRARPVVRPAKALLWTSLRGSKEVLPANCTTFTEGWSWIFTKWNDGGHRGDKIGPFHDPPGRIPCRRDSPSLSSPLPSSRRPSSASPRAPRRARRARRMPGRRRAVRPLLLRPLFPSRPRRSPPSPTTP